MERASGGRLVWAGAAGWAVAILAAAALAACDSVQAPAPPAGPAPRKPAAHPSVPDLSRPPARATPRPASRSATSPTSAWLINPDAPLPRHSPWWRVLAVARRFAAADLSYEVGEIGPAVWLAITETCTRAFAAALLSHRRPCRRASPRTRCARNSAPSRRCNGCRARRWCS